MNLAELYYPSYEYHPNPHVFTAFVRERPKKYVPPPNMWPPSLKSRCSIAIYNLLRDRGYTRRAALIALLSPDLRSRTHEISTALHNLVVNGRVRKRGQGRLSEYVYIKPGEIPKI